MKEPSKSRISNVEWGLLIGALFTIDLIQIGVEWLMSWWGIGLFINWGLDIIVGMSLAFYLQIRGQSMANPKRLFGLVATLGLEFIPVLDELPLWGLDGIFNMAISKSDKILKSVPGGGIISGAIDSANTSASVTDNRSFADKVRGSTQQIRDVNGEIIRNREEQ